MQKLCLSAVMFLLAGCGVAGSQDQEEVAQATGDVLSSLDEESQGGGFALSMPGLEHRPMFGTPWHERLFDVVLPQAHAAGCSSLSFTGCSAGQRVRTYGNCTFGGVTLDGTVTLNFSNPSCTVPNVGDTVTRTADFTLTGRRGATLAVTSPNGGQRVTRTANGFNYTVLGMHRVATTASQTTLFDITTHTTQDITVTGTNRANRVVTGGTLEVVHNVRGYTVDLTPNNVAWNATCNCPVSGSFAGTVTGNVTGTATLTLTGCGTGELVWNGSTENIAFDRCAGL